MEKNYTAGMNEGFAHLCKLLGKTVGYGPGDWYLVKWGGQYRIEEREVFSDGSEGMSKPFGATYRTAKNMMDVLYFAIEANEQYVRAVRAGRVQTF